ncbi:MAG: hypothetical protein V4568_11810 [Pseudomonadota bacterium]
MHITLMDKWDLEKLLVPEGVRIEINGMSPSELDEVHKAERKFEAFFKAAKEHGELTPDPSKGMYIGFKNGEKAKQLFQQIYDQFDPDKSSQVQKSLFQPLKSFKYEKHEASFYIISDLGVDELVEPNHDARWSDRDGFKNKMEQFLASLSKDGVKEEGRNVVLPTAIFDNLAERFQQFQPQQSLDFPVPKPRADTRTISSLASSRDYGDTGDTETDYLLGGQRETSPGVKYKPALRAITTFTRAIGSKVFSETHPSFQMIPKAGETLGALQSAVDEVGGYAQPEPGRVKDHYGKVYVEEKLDGEHDFDDEYEDFDDVKVSAAFASKGFNNNTFEIRAQQPTEVLAKELMEIAVRRKAGTIKLAEPRTVKGDQTKTDNNKKWADILWLEAKTIGLSSGLKVTGYEPSDLKIKAEFEKRKQEYLADLQEAGALIKADDLIDEAKAEHKKSITTWEEAKQDVSKAKQTLDEAQRKFKGAPDDQKASDAVDDASNFLSTARSDFYDAQKELERTEKAIKEAEKAREALIYKAPQPTKLSGLRRWIAHPGKYFNPQTAGFTITGSEGKLAPFAEKLPPGYYKGQGTGVSDTYFTQDAGGTLTEKFRVRGNDSRIEFLGDPLSEDVGVKNAAKDLVELLVGTAKKQRVSSIRASGPTHTGTKNKPLTPEQIQVNAQTAKWNELTWMEAQKRGIKVVGYTLPADIEFQRKAEVEKWKKDEAQEHVDSGRLAAATTNRIRAEAALTTAVRQWERTDYAYNDALIAVRELPRPDSSAADSDDMQKRIREANQTLEKKKAEFDKAVSEKDRAIKAVEVAEKDEKSLIYTPPQRTAFMSLMRSLGNRKRLSSPNDAGFTITKSEKKGLKPLADEIPQYHKAQGKEKDVYFSDGVNGELVEAFQVRGNDNRIDFHGEVDNKLVRELVRAAKRQGAKSITVGGPTTDAQGQPLASDSKEALRIKAWNEAIWKEGETIGLKVTVKGEFQLTPLEQAEVELAKQRLLSILTALPKMMDALALKKTELRRIEGQLNDKEAEHSELYGLRGKVEAATAELNATDRIRQRKLDKLLAVVDEKMRPQALAEHEDAVEKHESQYETLRELKGDLSHEASLAKNADLLALERAWWDKKTEIDELGEQITVLQSEVEGIDSSQPEIEYRAPRTRKLGGVRNFFDQRKTFSKQKPGFTITGSKKNLEPLTGHLHGYFKGPGELAELYFKVGDNGELVKDPAFQTRGINDRRIEFLTDPIKDEKAARILVAELVAASAQQEVTSINISGPIAKPKRGEELTAAQIEANAHTEKWNDLTWLEAKKNNIKVTGHEPVDHKIKAEFEQWKKAQTQTPDAKRALATATRVRKGKEFDLEAAAELAETKHREYVQAKKDFDEWPQPTTSAEGVMRDALETTMKDAYSDYQAAETGRKNAKQALKNAQKDEEALIYKPPQTSMGSAVSRYFDQKINASNNAGFVITGSNGFLGTLADKVPEYHKGQGQKKDVYFKEEGPDNELVAAFEVRGNDRQVDFLGAPDAALVKKLIQAAVKQGASSITTTEPKSNAQGESLSDPEKENIKQWNRLTWMEGKKAGLDVKVIGAYMPDPKDRAEVELWKIQRAAAAADLMGAKAQLEEAKEQLDAFTAKMPEGMKKNPAEVFDQATEELENLEEQWGATQDELSPLLATRAKLKALLEKKREESELSDSDDGPEVELDVSSNDKSEAELELDLSNNAEAIAVVDKERNKLLAARNKEEGRRKQAENLMKPYMAVTEAEDRVQQAQAKLDTSYTTVKGLKNGEEPVKYKPRQTNRARKWFDNKTTFSPQAPGFNINGPWKLKPFADQLLPGYIKSSGDLRDTYFKVEKKDGKLIVGDQKFETRGNDRRIEFSGEPDEQLVRDLVQAAVKQGAKSIEASGPIIKPKRGQELSAEDVKKNELTAKWNKLIWMEGKKAKIKVTSQHEPSQQERAELEQFRKQEAKQKLKGELEEYLDRELTPKEERKLQYKPKERSDWKNNLRRTSSLQSGFEITGSNGTLEPLADHMPDYHQGKGRVKDIYYQDLTLPGQKPKIFVEAFSSKGKDDKKIEFPKKSDNPTAQEERDVKALIAKLIQATKDRGGTEIRVTGEYKNEIATAAIKAGLTVHGHSLDRMALIAAKHASSLKEKRRSAASLSDVTDESAELGKDTRKGIARSTTTSSLSTDVSVSTSATGDTLTEDDEQKASIGRYKKISPLSNVKEPTDFIVKQVSAKYMLLEKADGRDPKTHAYLVKIEGAEHKKGEIVTAHPDANGVSIKAKAATNDKTADRAKAKGKGV